MDILANEEEGSEICTRVIEATLTLAGSNEFDEKAAAARVLVTAPLNEAVRGRKFLRG